MPTRRCSRTIAGSPTSRCGAARGRARPVHGRGRQGHRAGPLLRAIGRALRVVLAAVGWSRSSSLVAGRHARLRGPEAVLEAMTGYDVHRGALAAMNRPELAVVGLDSCADARLVVVLEGIVDHTNVGAIFRSAAGLGADAMLVSPTCADPLYRRSVKVSMGTVFQVPWTRIEPWPAALDELRARRFHRRGARACRRRGVRSPTSRRPATSASRSSWARRATGCRARRSRTRTRPSYDPHGWGSGLAQRGRGVGRRRVGAAPLANSAPVTVTRWVALS